MHDRALPPTWPSHGDDRVEISVTMASRLLLKYATFIQQLTHGANFENFSRSFARCPKNMYPNLCAIELCLVHGCHAEMTELKYLSQWRHNCTSNYGTFYRQRDGLILRIFRDHLRVAP